MQVFQIMWNGQAVGTAQVTQQGLYYQMECRCSPPDKEVYRVMLKSTAGVTDLGICVPSASGIGLITRLPVRKAGQGSLAFVLEKDAGLGDFIPVKEDAPFSHISSLPIARLRMRGLHAGIILQQAPELSSRGNGQSP